MHVSCAKRHIETEATRFLGSGAFVALCPRLGGGGANPKLVSNTLLRVRAAPLRATSLVFHTTFLRIEAESGPCLFAVS